MNGYVAKNIQSGFSYSRIDWCPKVNVEIGSAKRRAGKKNNGLSRGIGDDQRQEIWIQKLTAVNECSNE